MMFHFFVLLLEEMRQVRMVEVVSQQFCPVKGVATRLKAQSHGCLLIRACLTLRNARFLEQ